MASDSMLLNTPQEKRAQGKGMSTAVSPSRNRRNADRARLDSEDSGRCNRRNGSHIRRRGCSLRVRSAGSSFRFQALRLAGKLNVRPAATSSKYMWRPWESRTHTGLRQTSQPQPFPAHRPLPRTRSPLLPGPPTPPLRAHTLPHRREKMPLSRQGPAMLRGRPPQQELPGPEAARAPGVPRLLRHPAARPLRVVSTCSALSSR